MLGFIGTILLIVLKALTSKKIISIEECTMNGELEIIGILPDYERISWYDNITYFKYCVTFGGDSIFIFL